MSEQKVFREEFKIDGDAVIATIKELVHEGNVRRITIKNEQGQTLIEIPLTVGVVGAILLPVWAAIGAIAALAANLIIVVEKVESPAESSSDESKD
jgi:phage-related minor tail protein